MFTYCIWLVLKSFPVVKSWGYTNNWPALFAGKSPDEKLNVNKFGPSIEVDVMYIVRRWDSDIPEVIMKRRQQDAQAKGMWNSLTVIICTLFITVYTHHVPCFVWSLQINIVCLFVSAHHWTNTVHTQYNKIIFCCTFCLLGHMTSLWHWSTLKIITAIIHDMYDGRAEASISLHPVPSAGDLA